MIKLQNKDNIEYPTNEDQKHAIQKTKSNKARRKVIEVVEFQLKCFSRTEEYLHRVGRTARIGKSGSALLFLQPSELGFLDVLRGRGLTDLREMTLEEPRGFEAMNLCFSRGFCCNSNNRKINHSNNNDNAKATARNATETRKSWDWHDLPC